MTSANASVDIVDNLVNFLLEFPRFVCLMEPLKISNASYNITVLKGDCKIELGSVGVPTIGSQVYPVPIKILLMPAYPNKAPKVTFLPSLGGRPFLQRDYMRDNELVIPYLTSWNPHSTLVSLTKKL